MTLVHVTPAGTGRDVDTYVKHFLNEQRVRLVADLEHVLTVH